MALMNGKIVLNRQAKFYIQRKERIVVVGGGGGGRYAVMTLGWGTHRATSLFKIKLRS